jgi:hypothetical protein
MSNMEIFFWGIAAAVAVIAAADVAIDLSERVGNWLQRKADARHGK